MTATTNIKYPCGCINIMDERWQVLRNVSKCRKHTAAGGEGGLAYYQKLHTIIDGVPQCQRYVAELLEGMPKSFNAQVWYGKPSALEIGCGFSMYAPWLMSLGYTYFGVDLDPWAVSATAMAYNATTWCKPFEELKEVGKFNVILAAHCVEHFKDAPAALASMFQMLKPGGKLWIVIPDDTDKVNPDHLWFFSPEDIHRVLEQLNFTEVQYEVRQRVQHEKFIYVTATRP